jgi:hypothetical protein
MCGANFRLASRANLAAAGGVTRSMVASSVSSKVLEVQVGHFGCKLSGVAVTGARLQRPRTKFCRRSVVPPGLNELGGSSTLRLPDRRAELPRLRTTCEDDFLKPE